ASVAAGAAVGAAAAGALVASGAAVPPPPHAASRVLNSSNVTRALRYLYTRIGFVSFLIARGICTESPTAKPLIAQIDAWRRHLLSSIIWSCTTTNAALPQATLPQIYSCSARSDACQGISQPSASAMSR